MPTGQPEDFSSVIKGLVIIVALIFVFVIAPLYILLRRKWAGERLVGSEEWKWIAVCATIPALIGWFVFADTFAERYQWKPETARFMGLMAFFGVLVIWTFVNARIAVLKAREAKRHADSSTE
jgi:hypothetical protein